MGGIMSADDAVQYLLAGASAIQVGTANFADPRIASGMRDEIEAYAERNGLDSISDFRGCLD